jgi:autotransporter-associated beta strand protein
VLGQATYNGTTTAGAGAIQLQTGTQSTWSGGFVMNGGSAILVPGAATNLTISGAISGTASGGGIVIPAAAPANSTVTLSGAFTSNSALTVNAGTMVLAGSLAGTGTITLNNNQSTANDRLTTLMIAGSGPSVIAKPVILNTVLNVATSHVGVTVTGPNSVAFNGPVTGTSSHTYLYSDLPAGEVLTINGPLSFSASTSERTFHLEGAGKTIINGSINNSTVANTINGTLAKAGPGTAIVNSSAIAYTGGTSITAGTMIFANVLPPTVMQNTSTSQAYIQATGLGAVGYTGGIMNPSFLALLAGTNKYTVSATNNSMATGSLAIVSNADAATSIDFTTAPPFAATGASAGSWGSMGLGAAQGAYTYTGTLTPLGQNWRLGGGDGTLTFGQALVDQNATATNLVVLGGANGTLILTSTGNAYTGNTTVSVYQTLKNGVDNVLSTTGNLTLAQNLGTNNANTSVYDLAGHNQTIKALSGLGMVTSSAGSSMFTVNANGTSTFNGTVTGSLGFEQNGTGTMTLGGFVSYTGATVVNNGSLVMGGTNSSTISVHDVSGTGKLEVATGISLTSDGVKTGTLQIDAGASHTIRSNGSNAGASQVTNLAIAGSAGAWQAKLELNNNALIVESGTNAKADVIAMLSDQVAQGVSSGQGITVSTTAADKTHKLTVVVDNALAGLTQLVGVPVDASSVIVESTYYGDSNLDRKVDVTDLGTLATNYGKTVPNGILQGDFNGDGKVDVTDLGMLATDYGLGTSGGFALQAAAVPEPASIALLAFGGAAILMRHRRKR